MMTQSYEERFTKLNNAYLSKTEAFSDLFGFLFAVLRRDRMYRYYMMARSVSMSRVVVLTIIISVMPIIYAYLLAIIASANPFITLDVNLGYLPFVLAWFLLTSCFQLLAGIVQYGCLRFVSTLFMGNLLLGRATLLEHLYISGLVAWSQILILIGAIVFLGLGQVLLLIGSFVLLLATVVALAMTHYLPVGLTIVGIILSATACVPILWGYSQLFQVLNMVSQSSREIGPLVGITIITTLISALILYYLHTDSSKEKIV